PDVAHHCHRLDAERWLRLHRRRPRVLHPDRERTRLRPDGAARHRRRRRRTDAGRRPGGRTLMHVTADPLLIELPVGEPGTIAVSITNTSSMIDAYDVEAFGLDPAWTTVTPSRLSLFPSEVGIVEVHVTLPQDVPAGARSIAVHVRSENDRAEFA